MTSEERFIEAFVQVRAMASDIVSIKGTMQQVADALTRLAIVEERQANTNASIGRAFGELDKHDIRIAVLELAQPLQKQTTDWVQKAGWIVIGSVITAILALVLVGRPETVSRVTQKTTTEIQR